MELQNLPVEIFLNIYDKSFPSKLSATCARFRNILLISNNWKYLNIITQSVKYEASQKHVYEVNKKLSTNSSHEWLTKILTTLSIPKLRKLLSQLLADAPSKTIFNGYMNIIFPGKLSRPAMNELFNMVLYKDYQPILYLSNQETNLFRSSFTSNTPKPTHPLNTRQDIVDAIIDIFNTAPLQDYIINRSLLAAIHQPIKKPILNKYNSHNIKLFLISKKFQN